MDTSNERIEKAINHLSINYPDPRLNSNKSVLASPEKPEVISELRYLRIGMKQSKFCNVKYRLCEFENVALTGSQFKSVSFHHTTLVGNSFASCDLYNVEIDGSNCPSFTANNFSFSNFELCTLSNLQIKSSGLLNTMFHNCSFSNVKLQSSTLEGASFINCQMTDCDFSALNIEFSRFFRTSFSKVRFPFYQFPYVIGSADYIIQTDASIVLCAGDKTLSISEYIDQIDNLILFYLDKGEYFPACNLCIAKGDINGAIQYLLDGIAFSLKHHDFRMIRFFCQLALHHDMLDEVTRWRILQSMDNFLLVENTPDTQMNHYMTHIGNIRTLLHSGSSRSVTLSFRVKTNVSKHNQSGVKYVNSLITELNRMLSHTDGQNGFRVAVSNYSPYEVAVTVLSAVESVASIASLVWMTIDAVKKDKQKQKLEPVDIDIYRRYMDTRIDLLRADLLRLQKECSARRFSKYIDEVTQQLKTDLEDLYTKDILLFKVKNNNSSK